MYYPLGVTDPDYCVLKFTAHNGRFYCKFKSENFNVKYNEHNLQGDYRVSETVTLGAEIFNDTYFHFYDELQYLVGFTWLTKDFVIDGFYGSLGIPRSSPVNKYVVASGMYNLTSQFSGGAEFMRQTDDDRMYLTLKAKYTSAKNNFTFSYRLKNDDFDSELLIGHQYNL